MAADEMYRRGRRWWRLLIAALLLGAVTRAEPDEMKVASGTSVTLVPRYSGTPSEINWKKNNNKLLDMDLNPHYLVFYILEDRASIDHNDGRLTIRNLTPEDSGLYKSEVLVNSVIQQTDIRLSVLDCPAKPVITERDAAEKTVKLFCESSTPNVKYEWWKEMSKVTEGQIYPTPQPQEDVTLTCVVDNEACRVNATYIIHHISEPGLSAGLIFGIILAVLFVLLVIFILILICCPQIGWVSRLRSHLPCFRRKTSEAPIKGKTNEAPKQEGGRKSNDVERGGAVAQRNGPQEEMPLIAQGGGSESNDVEKEGAVARGKGTLEEMEPLIPFVDGAAESVSLGSLALRLFSGQPVQEVALCKVGEMSVAATLGESDASGTIETFSLTIDNAKDHGDYTAELHLPDGTTCVSSIKEAAAMAPMKSEGEGLTLEVPHTKGVQKITVKKGKESVYDLSVGLTLEEAAEAAPVECAGDALPPAMPDTGDVQPGNESVNDRSVNSPRLLINNLSLGPESIIINNLRQEDGGKYIVEVRSAENRLTRHTFTLEVLPLLTRPDNAEVLLKIMRDVTCDPPEKGPPEGPIGNITLHPINMKEKAPMTWRKGDQPVDTTSNRLQLCQNGDLIINNVTSEDRDKYTVQSGNRALVFDLRV